MYNRKFLFTYSCCWVTAVGSSGAWIFVCGWVRSCGIIPYLQIGITYLFQTCFWFFSITATDKATTPFTISLFNVYWKDKRVVLFRLADWDLTWAWRSSWRSTFHSDRVQWNVSPTQSWFSGDLLIVTTGASLSVQTRIISHFGCVCVYIYTCIYKICIYVKSGWKDCCFSLVVATGPRWISAVMFARHQATCVRCQVFKRNGVCEADGDGQYFPRVGTKGFEVGGAVRPVLDSS